MLKKTLAVACAGAFAFGASVQPASANLDLDEMAALLALPFLTAVEGSSPTTELVVTNGLAESINLHINVINGDPGEGWETSSFDCNVTARETTHFVISRDGDGSSIDFECSATGADSNSAADQLNIAQTEVTNANNGIMVIAVEQGGATVSRNAIFGDSTVIAADVGAAFSVGAIAFQGLDPLNQDGDRQYEFDGLEYAQFPSSLATNFLAPDPQTVGVLLLFTLDGTADVSPVPASARVFFYNDDETERDANFDFDCFTLIELEDIDPRFAAANLGSRAGHMTMTPRNVAVGTTHELTGLGVDGFRNTPFHGYLLQAFLTAEPWGEVDCIEEVPCKPQPSVAFSGRTLAQSVNAHVPLAGDVVNFDAR